MAYAYHTDAHMSGVLGETDYTSTVHSNWNLVGVIRAGGDDEYCAGCDGSFLLDFTSTSVGSTSGVFGVVLNVELNTDYIATVTLADSTVQDFALPTLPGFFGVTSSDLISSIHIGGPDGTPKSINTVTIDDLTIGASPVPEPTTILLLGSGLMGLLGFRKKFRK